MSTQYIHFTKEEKTKARMIDIVEFLRQKGEKLKPSGSEYEWLDGEQKVTIRGNLWYHQYDCKGGDAIDFIRRFYNMSYPEAVSFLLNNSRSQLITSKIPKKPLQKEIILPARNNNMQRVFAYLLKRRGIDRDVLYDFVCSKMIYESQKYHNAIFVGYDLKGVVRHIHRRGTGQESNFKGNIRGSAPEYSFHWHGTSDNLYIFESPIDMLSYISMNKDNWKSHSYAAACSVSDIVLWQMIRDNLSIKKVNLCLDNDKAGREANKRISESLKKKNIPFDILVPIQKDWNEDLLFLNKQEESECQELRL